MTTVINGTSTSASAPAVVGDDGDTGIYYPAANQVAIATGGAQRVLVDSSGLVSISGTGTEVLALSKSGGNNAYLQPVSSSDAGLQVKDSAGSINLTVGTSSKTLALQGGVVSSGTGITFPASQNASSDANTLDDYEEGTFTPYLSDGTNSVALGNGWYTKIGRMVYVEVQGYNTNYSSLSASGGLRITSLPFASPSGINSQFNLATNNTSTYSCVGELGSSSTTAFVYLANSTVDYTSATRNNLVGGASTFSFRTSFFYFST